MLVQIRVFMLIKVQHRPEVLDFGKHFKGKASVNVHTYRHFHTHAHKPSQSVLCVEETGA